MEFCKLSGCNRREACACPTANKMRIPIVQLQTLVQCEYDGSSRCTLQISLCCSWRTGLRNDDAVFNSSSFGKSLTDMTNPLSIPKAKCIPHTDITIPMAFSCRRSLSFVKLHYEAILQSWNDTKRTHL